jgi:hypothetical protein
MATDTAIIALSALAGVLVLASATLKGWQGWLAFKAQELDKARDGGSPGGMARIEIADLKERIRKLEAIAAGVDL